MNLKMQHWIKAGDRYLLQLAATSYGQSASTKQNEWNSTQFFHHSHTNRQCSKDHIDKIGLLKITTKKYKNKYISIFNIQCMYSICQKLKKAIDDKILPFSSLSHYFFARRTDNNWPDNQTCCYFAMTITHKCKK